MKIKNKYIPLFIIWSLASIIDAVFCFVHFFYGNFIFGLIALILSISFSFVSGTLMTKAIAVHFHNLQVDILKDFAEEFRNKSIEKIEPFEGFGSENK